MKRTFWKEIPVLHVEKTETHCPHCKVGYMTIYIEEKTFWRDNGGGLMNAFKDTSFKIQCIACNNDSCGFVSRLVPNKPGYAEGVSHAVMIRRIQEEREKERAFSPDQTRALQEVARTIRKGMAASDSPSELLGRLPRKRPKKSSL